MRKLLITQPTHYKLNRTISLELLHRTDDEAINFNTRLNLANPRIVYFFSGDSFFISNFGINRNGIQCFLCQFMDGSEVYIDADIVLNSINEWE